MDSVYEIELLGMEEGDCRGGSDSGNWIWEEEERRSYGRFVKTAASSDFNWDFERTNSLELCYVL